MKATDKQELVKITTNLLPLNTSLRSMQALARRLAIQAKEAIDSVEAIAATQQDALDSLRGQWRTQKLAAQGREYRVKIAALENAIDELDKLQQVTAGLGELVFDLPQTITWLNEARK